MRLKTIEDVVNEHIDEDVNLRLYGKRKGSLEISIYVNGSKWSWFSTHLGVLHLPRQQALGNIVATVQGYITLRRERNE